MEGWVDTFVLDALRLLDDLIWLVAGIRARGFDLLVLEACQRAFGFVCIWSPSKVESGQN